MTCQLHVKSRTSCQIDHEARESLPELSSILPPTPFTKYQITAPDGVEHLHTGNMEVQLPPTHQEHSASLGGTHSVHLWASKHIHFMVCHMAAKQMGDAQPHSGTDGQRLCLRPHYQHDQNHGTA